MCLLLCSELVTSVVYLEEVFRDRSLEELCRDLDEIIDLLAEIGRSREYLDKNLVPTSEGMKILRRVIRIMREKKLPCVEVVEKISQGYHYMDNVYECFSSRLSQCLESK